MGITIALETENGSQLASVEDPTNVLHRVLPSIEDSTFKWAGTIDWYGDTTFNYLQAQALRQEWGRVMQAAENAADAALLSQVDDLLRRAAGERHLYVKFYGD